LNFRGSYKGIEPLQGMFATAILKLPELPPDPKDGRTYDLNQLRQKNFDFVYDAGSGIQDVAVKKLRLSFNVKKGDRITLAADATNRPDGVYELLDQVGKCLPLELYNVTQVELTASVALDADKPPKAVTIRITHPNSCLLKYDELDLKLRDMLNASGIEPKEPAEANEAARPWSNYSRKSLAIMRVAGMKLGVGKLRGAIQANIYSLPTSVCTSAMSIWK
jgi:hypothetical protein